MEADEADEPVKDALPPQDNAMLVKARLTVDNRMGIPGTLHRIRYAFAALAAHFVDT